MKQAWKVRILASGAVFLLALTTACGAPKAENLMTLEECEAAIAEAADEAREAGFSAGYEQGLSDGKATDLQGKPNTSPEREAFVSISEAIPDAILEIRYYSTYNFVGDRIRGYKEPVALLTREAANALREVSNELVQQGYRLKIYDAYRPQQAVDHFKAWAEDLEDQRMKPFFYPNVSKAELFKRGYIAAKSGHSRGSTVDLTLFDMESGKEVDMGGTFDYFGECSHSDYTGNLTEEQLANRTLLRNVMLSHGFRGISTEWWHFTLKDEPYSDTYFNFPVEN